MFFWRIQTAWTILVEDHHRNISFKLYPNLSSGYWQEAFLSFLYRYTGKISPAAWRPCFLTNPNGLNNLGRGYQRKISAKLYGNRSSGFWQEDFQSLLYRYIVKISPAPWWPCFLTNLNGSNNLGRGSSKKHFCKIIWESVKWFLTRRFLKFSI